MYPTILYANGTQKSVEPKNGRDFSLEELQAIVGGYIEIVNLRYGIMVVNEDGRQKGLGINSVATFLAGQMIVGDVLVCNRKMVR